MCYKVSIELTSCSELARRRPTTPRRGRTPPVAHRPDGPISIVVSDLRAGAVVSRRQLSFTAFFAAVGCNQRCGLYGSSVKGLHDCHLGQKFAQHHPKQHEMRPSRTFKKCGTLYKPGCYLTLGGDQYNLNFGKVLHIVVERGHDSKELHYFLSIYLMEQRLMKRLSAAWLNPLRLALIRSLCAMDFRRR
ncbi:uncharacterized protein [Dermacentor albipictus]|uniref:uncharacterized protein isoform X4 n=1 Tax=Dermacentor albipictus TaxID=60249 RepID=UPI0038FBEA8E